MLSITYGSTRFVLDPKAMPVPAQCRAVFTDIVTNVLMMKKIEFRRFEDVVD